MATSMAAITPPPRRRPPLDSFHSRSLIDLASFHGTVYPDIYPSFLAFRDVCPETGSVFGRRFRRMNWIIRVVGAVLSRFLYFDGDPIHTNEEGDAHVCSRSSFVCKGLFPRVNWDSS